MSNVIPSSKDWDSRLRIVSVADLRRLSGLSGTTIWRERRRGNLPAPLRLSPGRIGWPMTVIEQWLASRQSVEG